MAAVSAPLASKSLTPPTSSHAHGAQSAWSYSVPIENQLPSESAANHLDYENNGSRQTLAGQPNGHLTGNTSKTDLYKTRPSRSDQLQNQGYIARTDIMSRKMSESDSEDNLSPDFQDNFQSRGAPNGTEHDPINGVDEDPEHSRWIHKDKLERMEHEEMERLGIRIPRSRAGSRSNGRSKSRDTQGQQKRQKIESIPSEEEHNWDLRLPEERYQERDFQDPQWEQAVGSRSASRIPVNKKSPLPIPIDFIERDTLMQYGKPAGLEDSISYSKSRGRSESVKVLEDSVISNTSKSAPRSVSGRRIATDVSPTKKTGPRKTSAPTGRATTTQQRPKTRSGSGSNGIRPVTRSGDFGSGSVSKRPEGDPPWLATMYKPDPRLPPDQQILPTHAKRMQQEQWEKDGKFGTTYDTSFRPLNDEEYGGGGEQPPVVSEPTGTEEKKTELQLPEGQPGWPLRGPKSPTLSTGRPGTAGGGGSYSTMPKISSPIRPHASPLPSPSVTHMASVMHIPEPPLEEEKKKDAGCACCIVM